MDPRFTDRLREALQSSELFDDWTAEAACRRFSLPGRHWEAPFKDDVAEKRQPSSYEWSETAVDAMRVCASCPVRRRCLEYAFEIEKSEGDQWWSGELVEEDRRFGIFGMVPGRIREHFAQQTDRIALCEEWVRTFAHQRRWHLREPNGEEEKTA